MTAPMQDEKACVESLVGQVADEFTERLNRGEHPDIEEYAGRYPEIAHILRQALPALQAVGSLVPGSIPSGEVALEQSPLAGCLGDFRIIRQIGRGGMGVVYEAEQISLGRRVALKVLPFAAALDSKQLQRFKNEAHAAAGLQHTNIVPVYFVGCERGVHFYAMQFVEGQTLAALIQELRREKGIEDRESKIEDRGSQEGALDSQRTGPFVEQEESPVGKARLLPSLDPQTSEQKEGKEAPTTVVGLGSDTAPVKSRSSILDSRSLPFFRTVANLGIQAAEALEHAHQLGVIHRDIKPANLMVENCPLPTAHCHLRLWITDFGLAHCQGGCELTMTGDLLGTLRYMSPEQALAKRVIVDERTDIYSLGVTLYELLTLQPAFPGTDRQEVLRQIAFDDPKPPRRWNKAIPAELETIVLKATEKNPADRYGTAKEVAEDLQHFLDDKPIRARRPTLVQRFRKWARRHPGVVRTAATALVVLMLALAVSNVLITQQKNQRDDALQEKGTALLEKDDALAKARANFDEAQQQGKLALERQKLAEKAELTARRRFYAAQINLAHQAWEAGQPARVLELLEGQRPKFDQEDLRGFEWYYLWRLCKAQQRCALYGHKDAIWGLAFSPDGKTLASGDYAGIGQLWDVATGGERATLVGGPSGWGPLAFSPDGKILALSAGLTVDATVTVWQIATGRQLTALQGSGMVRCIAFSPDGKILATGNTGGTVQLWDTATWQQRSTLRGHVSHVQSLAFSPDGKTVATADGGSGGDIQEDSVTRLWDLRAEPPRTTLRLHGAYSVAFSPDGKTLATGWGDLQLYEVGTGKELAKFHGHIGTINSVAFSPDGKMLVSGGADRTARIWEVATAQQRACVPHPDVVYAVAFSPDGQSVASAGVDRVVRVWDRERSADQTTLQLDPGYYTFVAFSPDGKRLISAGGQQIKLWDVATGQANVTLPIQQNGVVAAMAISVDGKMLASINTAGLKLLDLPTGQIRAAIPAKPGQKKYGGLAFSPDGKTLAMCCAESLRLWDVSTQRVRVTLTPSGGWLTSVAFSPDGKHLAAGGSNAGLKLWDAASGQLGETHLQGEGYWPTAVSFSPDGKTLASGTNGTVNLWEVDSGQLRASFKGHTDCITCLAFFPDGKTLATGSFDATVKLWDMATGQERVTLKGHTAPIASLAIAPDGNLLATANWDGVKLWRAATDKEATARKTELDPEDPDSPVTQNNLGDRLRATGRPKEAEGAYRRAGARLEKLAAVFPDVLAYREESARSHEGLEQWDQAAADLSKAVELQPGKLEPRLRRAEFYTRRGSWEQAADDWKHAADDFAKASDLSPDQVVLAYRHALARLGAGNLVRYRAICADLLEHFGTSPNPNVAHWVAWTCILAPDAVKDWHQPVQIAEGAVRADPKNLRYAGTLGAALYRAGRFGEAIKQLNDASAAGERGERGSPDTSPAYTWFFLAMANYRLGQNQEAQNWLDKAVKKMEQEIQNKDRFWNRRLTLHLFRREAENLLHGPANLNEKSE